MPLKSKDRDVLARKRERYIEKKERHIKSEKVKYFGTNYKMIYFGTVGLPLVLLTEVPS